MAQSRALMVGILQVDAEPWKSIYEQGQLPTWIKSCPPNVEIVNVYGDTPNKIVRALDRTHEKFRWSSALQGPNLALDRYLTQFLRKKTMPEWIKKNGERTTDLHVKVASMHLTLPIVELVLFKYFLHSSKADFLYMSNSSSYIRLSELVGLIHTFPVSKLYGGTKVTFGGIQFMSGANRILSRDLVEKLVSDFSLWDFSYIEDVSMGKLISGEDINFASIPSLQFQTKEQIDCTDIGELKKNVHFRLKSGSLDSRNDTELMHYLHKRLFKS
jgi:hypothetical protein